MPALAASADVTRSTSSPTSALDERAQLGRRVGGAVAEHDPGRARKDLPQRPVRDALAVGAGSGRDGRRRTRPRAGSCRCRRARRPVTSCGRRSATTAAYRASSTASSYVRPTSGGRRRRGGAAGPTSRGEDSKSTRRGWRGPWPRRPASRRARPPLQPLGGAHDRSAAAAAGRRSPRRSPRRHAPPGRARTPAAPRARRAPGRPRAWPARRTRPAGIVDGAEPLEHLAQPRVRRAQVLRVRDVPTGSAHTTVTSLRSSRTLRARPGGLSSSVCSAWTLRPRAPRRAPRAAAPAGPRRPAAPRRRCRRPPARHQQPVAGLAERRRRDQLARRPLGRRRRARTPRSPPARAAAAPPPRAGAPRSMAPRRRP